MLENKLKEIFTVRVNICELTHIWQWPIISPEINDVSVNILYVSFSVRKLESLMFQSEVWN